MVVLAKVGISYGDSLAPEPGSGWSSGCISTTSHPPAMSASLRVAARSGALLKTSVRTINVARVAARTLHSSSSAKGTPSWQLRPLPAVVIVCKLTARPTHQPRPRLSLSRQRPTTRQPCMRTRLQLYTTMARTSHSACPSSSSSSPSSGTSSPSTSLLRRSYLS
jgi:hypothetical protein